MKKVFFALVSLFFVVGCADGPPESLILGQYIKKYAINSPNGVLEELYTFSLSDLKEIKESKTSGFNGKCKEYSFYIMAVAKENLKGHGEKSENEIFRHGKYEAGSLTDSQIQKSIESARKPFHSNSKGVAESIAAKEKYYRDKYTVAIAKGQTFKSEKMEEIYCKSDDGKLSEWKIRSY